MENKDIELLEDVSSNDGDLGEEQKEDVNLEEVSEETTKKEEEIKSVEVKEDSIDNKEVVGENKKSKKGVKIIVVLLILIVLVGGILSFFLLKDNFIKQDKELEKVESEVKKYNSEYRMSGNSLEAFDLYFLQLENNAKNKIYSPLSIKYALAMLSEGASGDTKAQIDSVIGDYKAKKYVNSPNMSFANAMFIRNGFKDSVNDKYVTTLKNKFDAEIIYDSFENASNMNSWVKDKTLGLIDKLYDDDRVKDMNYALTNALAIDMEWNKLIQATNETYKNVYSVSYSHEKYSDYVPIIMCDDYKAVKFNNNSMEAQAVQIGASINNYDIVKELGEENIRKTVGDGYTQWLKEGGCGDKDGDGISDDADVETFLDGYMKELDSNYGKYEASTDFTFYVDDNVKVFAKDLKEYNGTTLQYVGIMPKTDSLDNYIKNVKASDINKLISSLKEVKPESFKQGVVTKITGFIPLFKFDYELNLIEDLKKLGITNVFDINKADLSNLSSSDKTYIDDARHKANIEFSNEGIKAAAVTSSGGMGAAGCGYDYLYDVPVEVIDLTFDNPYLFLIRDKKSGEVWFSGSVYEPNVHQDPVC